MMHTYVHFCLKRKAKLRTSLVWPKYIDLQAFWLAVGISSASPPVSYRKLPASDDSHLYLSSMKVAYSVLGLVTCIAVAYGQPASAPSGSNSSDGFISAIVRPFKIPILELTTCITFWSWSVSVCSTQTQLPWARGGNADMHQYLD